MSCYGRSTAGILSANGNIRAHNSDLLKTTGIKAQSHTEVLLCNDESFSLVALLRACAKNKDLDRGINLHDNIIKRGALQLYSDYLVTMYAKCGELEKAKELLDTHKSRDAFSWTALISGYANKGRGQDALDCFDQMQRECISPDAVTFASILKACGIARAADKGSQIHHEIARQGLLGQDAVIGNALVHMYAKCGALMKAQQVLEELPVRDVVSWSALIAGWAQEGQGKQALSCFEKMQQEGLSPNAVTLLSILKACTSIRALEKGQQIHDLIMKQGLLGDNIMLGNALVDMYAKCGALSRAQQLLGELPVRDAVSWNALIAGYAQEGQCEQALTCLKRIRDEGLSPDAVTFVGILNACGSLGAADKGEIIHDEITRQGLLRTNIIVGNALVDMYARSGALAKAQHVLDELPSRDVVSWNVLMAGYAQDGQGGQVLTCLERMQSEGLCADVVTFSCVLKACGTTRAADKGGRIHNEIVRRGLLKCNSVLGNALVDMYAKCSALAKARYVLEDLSMRDVVSWNALIAGYVQENHGTEALDCFEKMQREGLLPNEVTYSCILKACSSIGAVDKGEQIHDEIARQGMLEMNVVLGTALVDMYAKCGVVMKAHLVLETLQVRNVVSWNAIITGYAQEAQGERALQCIEQMQHEGISPDAVTLLCVLSACSHLGHVDDAETYFEHMNARYGTKPDLGHYACMIDVLARAGHLEKAIGVTKKLPMVNGPCDCVKAVWSALLGACLKCGDVKVARWAFECAVQVDHSDSAPYVLMADIFAAAGMQEDAGFIQTMRMGLYCQPGQG